MAQGRYVTRNHTTQVPRAFIYLDTEASSAASGAGTVQTFRCAVAALDTRSQRDDGWLDRTWGQFTTTESLWRWVEDHARAKARTVVVAHNLAYDLRIAETFRWLPQLGWELTKIQVNGRHAWASWRKGTKTLLMVDSMSWLNVGLAKVGELVGVVKPPLPAWEDSDDAWFARCRADVEILAVAWRRLMAWVLVDDLGQWKPTGAGQAWAAYRHRFMHGRLLAHTDESAHDAEQLAAHTGRTEAWRHGRLTGGPFTEWDFTCAYATIGAECKVPVMLLGETARIGPATLARLMRQGRVLGEVIVTTDVPVVPARHADRILWPTGTFRTTLWDTEIELAQQSGADVRLLRARTYRAWPALDHFCTWVLAQLDPANSEVDPVVRLALKHWSRALIGRFAAKWTDWETYGEAPYDDVVLGTLADGVPPQISQLLQVGRKLMRSTGERWAKDAVPSVMSWVMAEARVRLWRVMERAGLDHVAYCDTDSLIVDRKGHEALVSARVPGLRVKGSWERVTVLGPRQIVTQGRLRAAGVPIGAVEVAPGVFEAESWAQLNTSLSAREAGQVRVTPRTFHVRGVDHRRAHLPFGRTAPMALTLDAQDC